jgi:hypothetical protein
LEQPQYYEYKRSGSIFKNFRVLPPEWGVQRKFISPILIQEAKMNTKIFCSKNASITITGLAALLCAVVLSLNSCDLPGGPDTAGGRGTLTLHLPKTTVQGAGALNTAAGVSLSVLSDSAIGGLTYHVTLTGPGGIQTLEAGEGGTTLFLDAGTWTIEAVAYDPGDLTTPVGSGSAVIAVVAGQNSSVRIPMTIDPAYEVTLTEIYIHNEAELRRIGTDFAIDGSFITAFYLENDIVLTQSWTPIGEDSDHPFKAVFDGQGHSITVKSFSGPRLDGNAAGLGFFAYVDSATIQDLTINYELGGPVVDMRTGAGSTYYGGYAGGVAGRAENASFEDIQVTGNFSVVFDGDTSLYAGGIAGEANYGVTITNCRVTGTIGGTSDSYLAIGGIAGYISNPSYVAGWDISESSFTGTISGNSPGGNIEVGGIAGYMMNVEITGCHASTGTISGNSPSGSVQMGGIAGYMEDVEITGCHASGDIDGDSSYVTIGGIGGRILNTTVKDGEFTGTISGNSFSVSGLVEAGGIAGNAITGTIDGCRVSATAIEGDA